MVETISSAPEGRTHFPWWVPFVGILFFGLLVVLGLASAALVVIILATVVDSVTGGGPRREDVSFAILLTFGFLLTAIATVASALAAESVLNPKRWRDRHLARGRCPWCRYDIRHLPECRCPECGEMW